MQTENSKHTLSEAGLNWFHSMWSWYATRTRTMPTKTMTMDVIRFSFKAMQFQPKESVSWKMRIRGIQACYTPTLFYVHYRGRKPNWSENAVFIKFSQHTNPVCKIFSQFANKLIHCVFKCTSIPGVLAVTDKTDKFQQKFSLWFFQGSSLSRIYGISVASITWWTWHNVLNLRSNIIQTNSRVT